jgi:large subunit ribosomal protein L1
VSYQTNTIKNALKKVRESKKRKFVESIEILVSLRDVNLKDPSQRFSIESKVPHPLKTKINLAIFAEGDLAVKADVAENVTVVSKEQMEQLSKEVKRAKALADNNDFFLADRQFMPLVGRYFGKVLGPRGKMPKPVMPNVDMTVLQDEYARTIRLRVRENPCINARVATMENSDEEIVENIQSAIASIQTKLPRGTQQIRKIYIKSTMGPSILLEQGK